MSAVRRGRSPVAPGHALDETRPTDDTLRVEIVHRGRQERAPREHNCLRSASILPSMDESTACNDEDGLDIPRFDCERVPPPSSEHRFGRSRWTTRIASWAVAGVNMLLFALVGLEGTEDRWSLLMWGLLLLPLTWSLRHTLLTPEREVVVSSVGLRYRHLPETEVVPWGEIRGARQALEGLELLGADGAVRFILAYGLQRLDQLHRLVLEHASVGSPVPVRFRRSKISDVVLCAGLGCSLVAAAWLHTAWMCFLVVAMVLCSLYDQRRRPYAAEVTSEHIVLSFFLRTLRISLHDLEFRRSSRFRSDFYVVDPVTERTIVLRNMGVPRIVLDATLRAAVERLRPARGVWR